ncbi:MAG: spore maturation protein [Clostridia bacterium]|nr:spore maturation protein [Clostridia bacterium]
MNVVFALIIPLIFILSFLFAIIKKVKIYDSFVEGVKKAIPLIVSIFPYLASITMLSTLLDVSGLNDLLVTWLSPVFSFFGVPKEIAPLILIKPLSGSGSIALLSDILEKYGVDSYIARCACVAHGAAETVFYVGAVYFSGIKRKRLTAALIISLFAYLIAVVVGCALCLIL